MALDEPKSADEVFDEKGIKFIIAKDIFDKMKPINVDFLETASGSGFKLTSGLTPAGGCESSCKGC